MMGAAMIVALGGIVPIFLISLLIGRFVFKNKEIKKKVIYSTLIAYLIALLISGFGNANGGPFNPMIFEYSISTLMLIAFRLLLIKIRTASKKKIKERKPSIQ